jgi:hypothetical protein
MGQAPYGNIKKHGSNQYAHRFSWEMHFGPIPKGLRVLHSCDTPLCIRPDHLFLGTQLDNMRDCAKKNRWRNQFSVSSPKAQAAAMAPHTSEGKFA